MVRPAKISVFAVAAFVVRRFRFHVVDRGSR